MLAPQPENLPLTVRLGIDAAQTIRDVLLESSEQALTDKQQGSLSRTFCDVVDAIIAGGGMVGGLGERYTRVAAAHSVHNGLTVLPQTEKFYMAQSGVRHPGAECVVGTRCRAGAVNYRLSALQPAHPISSTGRGHQ